MRASTWVEVDGEILRRNVAAMAAATGGGVIPVVKANAYGHGLVNTARALGGLPGGLPFGVGTPDEALELRAHGISDRVLVMGYVDPDTLPDLVRTGVETVVWTAAQLDAVIACAGRFGVTGLVHLYIDVGMGRFGCDAGTAGTLLSAADASGAVEVRGVMGHLPSVDESLDISRAHVRAFQEVRQSLVTRTATRPVFHLASSTAIDMLPEADFDAVRPGLAVYGAVEAAGRLAGRLRPALSWYARIEDLTYHRAGDTIGYGGEYVCTGERELVAIAGVGYADGFRRVPKGVNRVLLATGHSAAVVGRVCTQHIIIRVPVEAHSTARVGDRITLLGEHGTQQITAPDLARAWGTNAWDVICNIGVGVPRQWRHVSAQPQPLETPLQQR